MFSIKRFTSSRAFNILFVLVFLVVPNAVVFFLQKPVQFSDILLGGALVAVVSITARAVPISIVGVCIMLYGFLGWVFSFSVPSSAHFLALLPWDIFFVVALYRESTNGYPSEQ